MIFAINISDLQRKLRLELLYYYHRANAGHIGASLSCIDLLIASLVLEKKTKDTFILSKGHAALALYVCLHHLGEITDAEMDTFYKDGTKLPAHPAAGHFASIPFALGSLGHGFPIAVGVAKADQLRNAEQLTFVLMSDGETNEGTTWEAMHFAVAHRLENLLVLIDRNGLQGFGHTKDILGDSADPKKWQQVGFEVTLLDGHDIPSIRSAVHQMRLTKNGKPKVIIGNTIKGKGVSYMENEMKWHYLPMTPELYAQAVKEIGGLYA